MPYLERLKKLINITQRKGAAIWLAYYEQDAIDLETASATLAVQIVKSNRAAASLASMAFAAQQTKAVQTLTPVPALTFPDDSERLHKAANTMLHTAIESEDPRAIVNRLISSEHLQAACDAFSAEMEHSFYAKGYRRLLNIGACERCVRWARGGKVFKPGTRFPMHPGCTCTPDPVFSTRDPSLPSYSPYT